MVPRHDLRPGRPAQRGPAAPGPSPCPAALADVLEFRRGQGTGKTPNQRDPPPASTSPSTAGYAFELRPSDRTGSNDGSGGLTSPMVLSLIYAYGFVRSAITSHVTPHVITAARQHVTCLTWCWSLERTFTTVQ